MTTSESIGMAHIAISSFYLFLYSDYHQPSPRTKNTLK